MQVNEYRVPTINHHYCVEQGQYCPLVLSDQINQMYTVSQKTGPLFTAYNFRNIEQIFTKFGTNQSLFILNIVPFKSTLKNSGAIY